MQGGGLTLVSALRGAAEIEWNSIHFYPAMVGAEVSAGIAAALYG